METDNNRTLKEVASDLKSWFDNLLKSRRIDKLRNGEILDEEKQREIISRLRLEKNFSAHDWVSTCTFYFEMKYDMVIAWIIKQNYIHAALHILNQDVDESLIQEAYIKAKVSREDEIPL